LVASSGRRTQSKGETLEFLLTTNFPNSENTQESAVPASVLLARRLDWSLATRIVIYRRVDWAIASFARYKIPEVDGIFLALLQKTRNITPYMVRIFCDCLATGYVPGIR
jgi:hypothetical protein